MIKVAICDDDTLQLDILLSYFELFCDKFKHRIEVSTFSSGNELLSSLAHKEFDIYILDLIMPQINGMEVAQSIRQKDTCGKILFLSSSKDFVFDAFSVKASDYILKPLSSETFYKKISELCDEIDAEKPPVLTIKTLKGDFQTPVKDILYIENINRTPYFHMINGNVIEGFSKRGKFSDIIESLSCGQSFALSSVSIAVNLNNIVSFKKDTNSIYLVGNKELFCSRSFSKSFKESLKKYRNL